MRDKIWYMAIVLGLCGAVAGAALSMVKTMTDPVIENAILQDKIKPTLDKYFGDLGLDNDPIADRVKLELGKDELGRKQFLMVFKGVKGGKMVAAALQTATSGYGGDVVVLTAFDLENKKLLGVKTLDQKETKGLGSRVADDNEPFIKQFANMEYEKGIAVKADGGQVDAIAGATISSKAFCGSVNKAKELLAEKYADIEGAKK